MRIVAAIIIYMTFSIYQSTLVYYYSCYKINNDCVSKILKKMLSVYTIL